MGIVSGLSAINSGFELTKKIRDLLEKKKVDKQEISARLLELQELMLQAQSALGEAQEENRKLKEQLAANDRMKEIEADLEWESDGGFYFRKSEKAKGSYPYYCPVCWGEHTKLIPLTKAPDGAFHCGSHNGTFYPKESQELQAKQAEELSNPLLRGSHGAGKTWMGG